MILENLSSFLDKLFAKLAEKGIDVSEYEMDHIGYQCSSSDDYDKLKLTFSDLGVLLDENIVGDRRVGLFKLREAIQYKKYLINAIELIEPKKGQICLSSLEHVEFVINEQFDTFVARYPTLQWDTSAVNQPMFPMVKLPLGDNIQVKFHHEHVFDIAARKKKAI